MGLNDLLARLAVRAAQVLVVEVPGHWRTRVEVEQELSRRGWRPAWTPADADVLAVCGSPGPRLAQVVERLWDGMPGPRVRADVPAPGAARSALDDAAALLLDTPHHRHDAGQRPDRPGRRHDGHADTDHGDMDHGDMDHGDMDHGDMDHGDMDHGDMDHGDMDMAPEGTPLAGSGEDRDGLEMDVLHVPLGPVLPHWPAGLVLRCTLQGDVVVDAEAEVLDAGPVTGPQPAGPQSVAVRCDNLSALLGLAGLDDAASRARRARDAVLRGELESAAADLDRLYRGPVRSRRLRWVLRGVLPLGDDDVARHLLPGRCRGDAHDRVLALLDRARGELTGGAHAATDAVPVTALPPLLAGVDLAVLRLAVASLDLAALPADREAARG